MFSSAIQRLNDRRDAAGDSGAEAGFTLIELMVVLLILAILLAIAIPTFLGVTKSANDRAAQSNLKTAMLNAKAAYQSNSQSYGNPSPVNAAVLQAAEPGVSFVTGNSTGQGVVSVFPTADGNAIVLAVFTKSNNCWYQIDNPSGATAAVAPFTTTAGSVSGGSTAMSSAVTTVTAGSLLFSGTTAGTMYVEVKGDTTASDCSASNPKIPTTTSYQWQTTGFPSN
jgi:type IV pilus assembly protein PilA